MKALIVFITNLLIIFTLTSCTSKSNISIGNKYIDFPKVQELKGKTVLLDTALFHYSFRVHIMADKAVVMDLHGVDYFFHAFSYPDFHYQSSFGKRGDSPEEMLSAENFRWNGKCLWTLDANKSELTKLVFALSGDTLLRKECVKLNKEILRALDFVVYEDSTFIIPDYSGDSRFCIVDSKGKMIRHFGVIPTTNEAALENSRPALAQAWRSFIDYNPRKDVLAAVTQLGEVLEIYNLKDSTQHIVRIGPHGEPEFQISGGYGIPTGIMGFSDVQVTDNAIYAVFHGRTFKEIAQEARGGKNLDGGQYIYMFSLNGEPIKKFVLDHYIYGISVNESEGIIIALDVNVDESILQYNINM